jgi:AcrR family transcriptional regulator
VTKTPWGDSDELRAARLRPGFRLPRESVARNQRWRLMAAMVAAVAERGYEATTVAHVVELSGVSRTAFYRQFANKEECFVATVDAILGFVSAAVTEAWRSPGDWDERLRAAFEAFVDQIVSQPAAARIGFIDVYVAGANAIEHVDQGIEMFARMTQRSFEESPERAGMPPLVLRALVGGIHKVIASRLRRGDIESLPATVPALWEWALAYRTPATPLRRRKIRSAKPAASRFVPQDQIERLCAAMATVCAEKGYAGAKIEDVVATASVSLSTFYDHFETKEEAFVAAYDVGLAQASAAAVPPFLRESDWRYGTRAFAEGMLRHLTAEPDWARLGIVEALAAGPRALERRDDAVMAFAALLQPGFESRPDLPPIVAEAISGGIYALIYDHIRTHGTERLLELQPVTTFFGLVPFVGVDEAVAIANEPLRGRGRSTD